MLSMATEKKQIKEIRKVIRLLDAALGSDDVLTRVIELESRLKSVHELIDKLEYELKQTGAYYTEDPKQELKTTVEHLNSRIGKKTTSTGVTINMLQALIAWRQLYED